MKQRKPAPIVVFHLSPLFSGRDGYTAHSVVAVMPVELEVAGGRELCPWELLSMQYDLACIVARTTCLENGTATRNIARTNAQKLVTGEQHI
jgi:hypothetical protein